jgi:tetratricopeptide (TPR) repeat protein
MKNNMINNYITFLVILLVTTIESTNIFAQDRIGIPGPLIFDKINYNFNQSIKTNEATYVQQYLPENETSDNFNQMLICKVLITDLTAQKVAEIKMKQLGKIRKTDSFCNSRIFKSPDNNEFIVDYFLGEYTNENKLRFIDYYVYRYKRIKLENNNDAVLAFVFMRHSNGNNQENFINEINKLKNDYVDKMSSVDLPTIKLQPQELLYLKDPTSVKGYTSQLTTSQEKANSDFLEGASFNKNHQYSRAIEKLKKAIEIDSTGNCGTGINGTAFGELGNSYFKMADSDSAIWYFDKGIHLNKHYPINYLHKATVLAMQNKNDEAIKTLDELILNISNEPIAFAQRGILYDSTKAELALKDFDMFLTLIKDQNQEEPLKEMVEFIQRRRIETEKKLNKK